VNNSAGSNDSHPFGGRGKLQISANCGSLTDPN
jgi:hypothetical protein